MNQIFWSSLSQEALVFRSSSRFQIQNLFNDQLICGNFYQFYIEQVFVSAYVLYT